MQKLIPLVLAAAIVAVVVLLGRSNPDDLGDAGLSPPASSDPTDRAPAPLATAAADAPVDPVAASAPPSPAAPSTTTSTAPPPDPAPGPSHVAPARVGDPIAGVPLRRERSTRELPVHTPDAATREDYAKDQLADVPFAVVRLVDPSGAPYEHAGVTVTVAALQPPTRPDHWIHRYTRDSRSVGQVRTGARGIADITTLLYQLAEQGAVEAGVDLEFRLTGPRLYGRVGRAQINARQIDAAALLERYLDADGGTEVRLVAYESLAITLRVVDPEGDPVSGVTLAGTPAAHFPDGQVVSDGEGLVTLRHVLGEKGNAGVHRIEPVGSDWSGSTRVGDVAGWVRNPVTAARAAKSIQNPELSGGNRRAVLGWLDHYPRIVVTVPRTFPVDVVDERGTAIAGMPCRVMNFYPGAGPRTEDVTTDGQGRLTLRLPQTVRAIRVEPRDPEKQRSWHHASVKVTAAATVLRAVCHRRLRVGVTLIWPSGRTGEATDLWWSLTGHGIRGFIGGKPEITDGRIHVVAPARPATLTVTSPAGDLVATTQLRGTGDESVVLTLQSIPMHDVRVQLRDPDGQPVRNGTFRQHLNMATGRVQDRDVTTNDAGEFVTRLPAGTARMWMVFGRIGRVSHSVVLKNVAIPPTESVVAQFTKR